MKVSSVSVAFLLIFVMAFSFTACSTNDSTSSLGLSYSEKETFEVSVAPEDSGVSQGDNTSKDEVEVVVFAAASMTETLEQIADLYKEVSPNVTLTFNFDSSGTLKTQIEEGAECDVFISAGQKQMDQLDIAADESVNTDGLDFIEAGTRIDLLENKVTLCVPAENPAEIVSFDALSDKLKGDDILMAMGNSDVPVGQYTQKILEYYGLNEETLAGEGKITYGTNVKEVTTQISEASVDCGVVYCTDAYSAGLEIVDYATVDMCGKVIYPAAVLSISDNQAEAVAFLNYLQTEDAMAIFESVGFSKA